jgi:hypothetical protein
MKRFSQRRMAYLAAVATVAGAVALPVGVSAATQNSSVEASVASVISVSSSGTVSISVTPTGSGVLSANASDSVTVNSNGSNGYDLTLSDTDSTVTMTGYKDDGVTSNSSTLAATSGTFGSPGAMDANSWGWRVDGLGTFGAGGTATYAGMPANSSPQNIKSTATTASSDVTTVKYAVKVDTSKPNGIYKDTVTYTATAK